MILEDNTFSDITFQEFHSNKVKKIGTNTFNKTADKILSFFSLTSSIEHQPPKYDLQTILNQMTQLESLAIGINVDEIPSNAIRNKTNLPFIKLANKQNLTIKPSAFYSLDNLYGLQIVQTTVNRIEKEAFKSATLADIIFDNCRLSSESFQMGAFDGITNPIKVTFLKMNISYLAESVFKPILKNSSNSIDFFDHEISKGIYNSKIDCDDCKNYWLIRENKQNQVKNAHCKADDTLTLFDQETKTKLSQKCN